MNHKNTSRVGITLQKKSMNTTERLASKLGLVLCGALIGCAAFGQPSASIGVTVPLPFTPVLPYPDLKTESTVIDYEALVGENGLALNKVLYHRADKQ